MVGRIAILLFGSVSYLVFLSVFIYAIGFIGGFITPTQLDGRSIEYLPVSMTIDGLLLLQFALQHSIMARPGFKNWLTRYIPRSMERSLYVLLSSLSLGLLFALWQPFGGTIWDLSGTMFEPIAWIFFGLGWLMVLLTTFSINHFDLFGLRQVWLQYRGIPYTPISFKIPRLYRWVRHPLYVGWLLAFWSTPLMSLSHFIFVLGTTVYILLAIRLEERDLTAVHPEYSDYQQQVPMLIPRIRLSREIQ